MKKTILLFTFLISFFSKAQDYDYINLTKPRPDNLLSIYLNNSVPNRLLKNVRYPKNKHNIILSFYVNKIKEPYKIKLNNSYNKELNAAITKAFLNYPLKNLDLEKIETQKKYSLQVVIQRNKLESIFSCSTTVLTHSLPVCDSCNDLEFYEDIEKCLKSKLNNYFEKNIDSTSLRIAKEKTKNLKAKLKLDKEGKLILKKEKGFEVFTEATKNFPVFNAPAMLNNAPTNFYYTFYPFSKKKISITETHTKLGFVANTSNEFAKFLSERLDSINIKNEGLNRLNCTISLHFELDKKGNPIHLKTNARTKNLENQIFKIFKAYPFDKLNLGEKSVFTMYTTPILTFDKGKITIETYPTLIDQKFPIFPGCKNSKNILNLKACFSKGVQKHFAKNFDSKIPNKLGLSTGRKRVFIGFKISKKGKVIDIMARAPHKKIKEEVIRVMKRLPKMKPGSHGGTLVNVKYSIPFTLIVE